MILSLQKSISKLIFACCTGSKNPVRNRLKIQFFKLDFSKLIFQKSSMDQQRESRLLLEFFKKSDCRNQMALECIQNNAHKSSQLSLLSLLICTLISENLNKSNCNRLLPFAAFKTVLKQFHSVLQ